MPSAVFSALSPLDHRYRMANPDLYAHLSRYLSEEAYVRYQLQVEAALVEAFAARGLCPPHVADQVKAAAAQVTAADVHRHEQITRHNIRALVNALSERVSPEARPFIHLTATSADVMDTARALQYRDAARHVVVPKLKEVLRAFIAIAQREAHTPQMGRTHGQHAVPITFGFAMAEDVSRLGGRIVAVEQAAQRLPGKMAGAVGAYNAARLLVPDPDVFEREVLGRLGLEPADHSTQVVEPEYGADFAHALVTAFGVLANAADDIRHLQRTEIGEVGEAFDAHQVGSSTMPHKRNPWNFEHVKSLWKAMLPRIMTVYMDQISEHQRDLTNSASGRFFPELMAGLVLAADRMARELARLGVDRERMARNMAGSLEMVVAEPLYVLLAAHGHPAAHEEVRRLTLEAERTGQPLRELAARSLSLAPYMAQWTPEQRRVIDEPAMYLGMAAEKALAVCRRWSAYLETGQAGPLTGAETV